MSITCEKERAKFSLIACQMVFTFSHNEHNIMPIIFYMYVYNKQKRLHSPKCMFTNFEAMVTFTHMCVHSMGLTFSICMCIA